MDKASIEIRVHYDNNFQTVMDGEMITVKIPSSWIPEQFHVMTAPICGIYKDGSLVQQKDYTTVDSEIIEPIYARSHMANLGKFPEEITENIIKNLVDKAMEECKKIGLTHFYTIVKNPYNQHIRIRGAKWSANDTK